MASQWSVVVSRAVGYARGIRPSGVSGALFARDVLFDVDPRDVDEVLGLLHRRKVVFVSRQRGAVLVYGAKPEAQPRVDEANPLDRFVADVAPLVLSLLDAVEERDRTAERELVEARERVSVIAGRIGRLCRKNSASGLALPAIRSALWRLFPVSAIRAVAFHEPRLQRSHEAVSFEAIEDRPARVARGLVLEEKVAAMIEKAGTRGLNRSDVLNGVRPRIDATKLDEVAGQLIAAGLVVSGVMRVGSRGRSGVRYFSASVGLPLVNAQGEAVFSA